jgi:hypothetical protein
MKKICVYFYPEVSGALIDMGEYDGICLKRRKDKLILKKGCLKSAGCKKWAETIPIPEPKKVRRHYDLLF